MLIEDERRKWNAEDRCWEYYDITGHFLHRDGDKPARICDDGKEKEWYYAGLLHREGDKPARIQIHERQDWKPTMQFYKRGKLHRDYEPAQFWGHNNCCGWFKEGKGIWGACGERCIEARERVLDAIK